MSTRRFGSKQAMSAVRVLALPWARQSASVTFRSEKLRPSVLMMLAGTPWATR